MKKIQYILLFLALQSLTFMSCTQDDEWQMTSEQRNLIGTGVNFQPYISDFNTSTRAVGEPGSVYNGGFNRGDMMYIYRQYVNSDGTFSYPSDPTKTLPGTIYMYKAMTYGETNIFEKSSWKPYKGKKFSMKDGTYEYTMPNAITDADSIIWENGSTVRFRCWTLSSLGNSLGGDTYTVNYPDYSVCDWVTVSGPTENIPMAMRHLGCRLAFAPYGGNAFVNSDQFRIAISTDWQDYMRDDNADTDVEDAADKAPTEAEARTMADAVKAAYNKMCFPAGVDMNDFSLLACKDVPHEKDKRETVPYSATYQHGTLSTSDIATNIRRPEFIAYAGGYNYMVTVPYDMSSENDGKNITLPPYTRFKVYLRDVNQGDKNQGMAESDYHIFVLSDVMKRDGNGNSIKGEHPFADGLTLKAGYSYQFYVGYHYNGITVTAADNFSWTEQDLAAAKAVDQMEDAPVKDNFKWWHDAINSAIERVQKGTDKNYNPVFHISNEQEYQEFIDLVNGNFKHDGGIHKYRTVDSKTKEVTIKWYTSKTEDAAGTHYEWITQEGAEALGYVFYNRYHPSDADRDAYAEIDVLDAPYSFFDSDVQRRFTVYLDQDLDLKDWPLESVGKTETIAFDGNFDGQGHTINNVYIRKRKDGSQINDQLFGYAKNGVIKNLRVVSTHPISIVGTCDTERILGCSVVAPSTTAALAERAIGTCYFVGCSHIGNTSKPLVADGDYFFMYGCMQAASGINGGALCGIHAGSSTDFVMPQGEFTELKDVYWGNFACNYYDITLSPSAVAVTGVTWKDDDNKNIAYNRRQYIRGTSTNILCAKNDNLIDVKADWKTFQDTQRAALYGVAPWRAMNYAIKKYNDDANSDLNRCQMHYENNTTGYVHRYPTLEPAIPGSGQYEDVTDKYN